MSDSESLVMDVRSDGTPARRMPFMTADSSESGPQTKTWRPARSGIQAFSVSGANGSCG